MDKKGLQINAAFVDARNTQEETIAQYTHVQINAATIVTTAETRKLLGKYGVQMNSASIMDLPEGCEFAIKNGSYTLDASTKYTSKLALLVNGSLNIESGADVENIICAVVNGSLRYPESMAGQVARFAVNGSSERYPDGAILLKNVFIPDRVFALRAKNAVYVARRVIMLDSGCEVEKLTEKGVRFLARHAIVSESLLEAAIALFDDKTEIQVVPDGTAYINSDAVLDGALVQQYGYRLYINGDLKIEETARELFKEIAYLEVNGEVELAAELADDFRALHTKYKKLILLDGSVIQDRPEVEVTAELLELSDKKLTVRDCASVRLDNRLSSTDIAKKLVIMDCANVSCTPEQKPAVELISTDVTQISTMGDADRGAAGSEDMEDRANTVVINTAQYVL